MFSSLALGDPHTFIQCPVYPKPSLSLNHLVQLHTLDLGLGDGDRAVQPVLRAVLPLVHSGCPAPGGLPAVLERFHRSTTRVPVWTVLPVGYKQYYRFLLGDGSTARNHRLVPGSGTTILSSGTTAARLWAYI